MEAFGPFSTVEFVLAISAHGRAIIRSNNSAADGSGSYNRICSAAFAGIQPR
jgi:hypothetical protein